MSSDDSTSQWDIRLPEPAARLHPSHLRKAPLWTEFMNEIEHEWLRYMRHHDSPERRLRDKNPEPFRMP